ncbi:hypothetical protein H9P43_001716 [Blastocladiella emersonii ATCC 22665]|nr:hypothetical protein H9P43_001716 [Blastocladiella emersonii ATCC 22665]
MAQGLVKNNKAAASITKHHRKPEKAKVGKGGVAKNSKLQKKLKAQSVNDIERLMATRAAATGKLNMMKKLADPSALNKKNKKGTKAAKSTK